MRRFESSRLAVFQNNPGPGQDQTLVCGVESGVVEDGEGVSLEMEVTSKKLFSICHRDVLQLHTTLTHHEYYCMSTAYARATLLVAPTAS